MKNLFMILSLFFSVNVLAGDAFSPQVLQYRAKLNKQFPQANIAFKQGAQLASDHVLNDRLRTIEKAFKKQPVQAYEASDIAVCCHVVCGGCGAARVSPSSEADAFIDGLNMTNPNQR